MSLIRLFKEKKTPEEVKAIRDVRAAYYKYINDSTNIVLLGVKGNTITPETGSEISKLLMDDKKWLQRNPTPDIEDIGSKYETLLSNINDLLNNDKPKIVFKNTLKIYKATFESQARQNIITGIQHEKLKELLKKEEEWYTKNTKTATELDYLTQIQDLNNKILDIGLNPDTIEKDAKINLEKENEVKEKKKKVDENEVSLKKGAYVVGNTAYSVFMRFLYYFLLGLSATYAANLAIGRPPIYRLLYFLYGMRPYFVPFVLIYVIYTRIRNGPIPIYAILPVSTEPALTRLGRYLWYPFFWIPDQQSMNAYVKYQDSLTKMVA